MIKVTIGNNVKHEDVIVDENLTLREVLENNGIDYSVGTMNLDGSSVKPGGLNSTFKELGYDGTEDHNRCYLLNVVKADNA